MSLFCRKDPVESKCLRLHYIALAQIVGLALLLLAVFVADRHYSQKNIERLAESVAHIYALKDSSYRDLFIKSGGIYLSVSDDVSQDPSLSIRPDRDLTTLSGSLITLVRPKKLLQLAHDFQDDFHGLQVESSLKTMIPFSKEDTPDEWEAQAIRAMQQGSADVSAVVRQDGQPVLRYMYPLLATEGCLKNRKGQGYEVGDVLGGFSVTVPLAFFSPLRQDHMRHSLRLYVVLFILGGAGIFLSFRKTKERDAVLFEAQQAQQDAYDELEKTFDAIDDIITIQDQDMRITRVNRATCEMFNAQPEDLVGKYCYEIFRGATKPCPDCPELVSLRDGVLHHGEIEHERLHKIFTVAASPVISNGGEAKKIVHYAKDITESRRQELQLRQSQKMEAIGTLAGGIAHDFNNILTAVMGFAELAKMHQNVPPEVDRDLEQIHQAGIRARELVQQILTFSRRNEYDFKPLDIQPVVRETVKLLRATIPSIISFDINIFEGRVLVVADDSQIHQVVLNLCTNAYHAMRETGGTLTVSLCPVELSPQQVQDKPGLKPGSYLRLLVRDTGKGIETKDLERIFEPYFTTKKKGEGTGLGLSLVHGIVRSMGGDISVFSEKNKGTTFHVYLPVFSDTDREEIADDADVPQPLPGGNEQILIVDDEEVILRMEERMLQGLGYGVAAFDDPVQAKEAFYDRPDDFDLVITDMNMPKMSGLELIKSIQQVRADMPIVICTGYSDQINNKTIEEYGLKKVMMKPLVIKAFSRVVRDALDS